MLASYFTDMVWLRHDYEDGVINEHTLEVSVNARNDYPHPTYRVRAYIQRAVFGYVVED